MYIINMCVKLINRIINILINIVNVMTNHPLRKEYYYYTNRINNKI